MENIFATHSPALAPPWYRQPWPWVLIGLPGAAVIASIVSLCIAIHGADDLVADNYYKQGLAINRELSADASAHQRQLRAWLNFSANAIELDLRGQTSGDAGPLTLRFIHPVSAARDFTLPLQRDSDGRYRARLPQMPIGRWTVDIENASAHWRLRGTILLTHERQQFAIGS